MCGAGSSFSAQPLVWICTLASHRGTEKVGDLPKGPQGVSARAGKKPLVPFCNPGCKTDPRSRML